jgi:hypothetical protein
MLMNTPAKEDAGTRQSRAARKKRRAERNSFIEILQTLSISERSGLRGQIPEEKALLSLRPSRCDCGTLSLSTAM